MCGGSLGVSKISVEENNKPDINPMKLYDLLINNDNLNIPPKTMLHQIYKEYKSMKDLFIIF